MNLAASAIKYSLARSKKVINIDNHITSGGGYSYFQKWLEDLSDEEELLPGKKFFIAFVLSKVEFFLEQMNESIQKRCHGLKVKKLNY